MTTVLINGIDTLLGSRIALLLSNNDTLKVLGMGRQAPAVDIGRARFLPMVAAFNEYTDLLRSEQVNAVLHLDFLGEEQPIKNREQAVQRNVLRSIGIMGSCAAAGVQRVVLRSSTLVHGASMTNPALIAEGQPPGQTKVTGLLSNYREVEAFAADFASKHPNMQIAWLRCAGLVGKQSCSPLAHYLAQRMPPLIAGFAPRFQVLHLDDAAQAFALAATTNVAGAIHIATEPCVTLQQAVQLVGKQPAWVPAPLLNVTSGLRIGSWPYDRDFLRYSCLVRTTRAQQELGWQPTYQAHDALREMRSK
jgi:UDP-glucose 4-epimerase